MTKAIVQVIDQLPSSTVGKSEVASRLGDRSGLMNLFKETNFARTNGAPAPQIYPQCQSRLFHVPLPSFPPHYILCRTRTRPQPSPHGDGREHADELRRDERHDAGRSNAGEGIGQ
jgi:hypothetical protein